MILHAFGIFRRHARPFPQINGGASMHGEGVACKGGNGGEFGFR